MNSFPRRTMKSVVRATLIALTLVLSAVPFAGTPGLTIDYPAEGAGEPWCE